MKLIVQRTKHDCGTAALATFTGMSYERIAVFLGVDPSTLLIESKNLARVGKLVNTLTIQEIDNKIENDAAFAAQLEPLIKSRYGVILSQICNVLFLLSIPTYLITTVEGAEASGYAVEEAEYRNYPNSRVLHLKNRQALLCIQQKDQAHWVVWDDTKLLDPRQKLTSLEKQIIFFALIRVDKLTHVFH
jgi:hypothetical protein